MRYSIPVCEMEFEDTGDTIWIHSPKGATVVRIKCLGGIQVEKGCMNPVAHVDFTVPEKATICMP